MEENNPFEEITEDWYHCSILDKEVRFVSHMLRGVTYFIVLETRKGDQYDVPIKKPDIVQYLSKFTIINNNKMKDQIEDFTDKEDLEDDENEVVVPKQQKLKPIVKTEENKPAERNGTQTISSLRDELFDVIQLLKSGKIEERTAQQIANVSQVIINSAKLEMEYRKTFTTDKKIKMLEQ